MTTGPPMTHIMYMQVLSLGHHIRLGACLARTHTVNSLLTDAPDSGLTRYYTRHSSMHGSISLY